MARYFKRIYVKETHHNTAPKVLVCDVRYSILVVLSIKKNNAVYKFIIFKQQINYIILKRPSVSLSRSCIILIIKLMYVLLSVLWELLISDNVIML